MTHFAKVLGLAFAVTGGIALVHYILRSSGRLPDAFRNDTLSPRAELIVSVALIVIGVPVAVIAFTSG